jgi:hypothetical protein
MGEIWAQSFFLRSYPLQSLLRIIGLGSERIQTLPPRIEAGMIVAIDPGPIESAFVRMEGTAILECGKEPNELILERIPGWRGWNSFLAIEMIASYGMPVGAEVFQTCVWIGRFIEKDSSAYQFVYRKDVKMHICGSVKANDANIRQALVDRFGPKGTKKNPGHLYGLKADMWSAFAVGLTALEKK